MRIIALLLVLPLVFGLTGCGDAGEPGLRIDVETYDFDGALPSGLRIRRLNPEGTGEEVYDLEAVPGGRTGEYQAHGAPDGPYALEGPAGWWMLNVGATAPLLVRGQQPPQVGLGHGHSVYLGAQSPHSRPSDIWGAVRILADGAEEPVPVTVDADERGYVVAVRFAPEAWRGTLQVIGRVAIGPAPSPSPGVDAPLTEPVRFEATTDGAPVITRMRPASTGPLQVVLVGASEAVRTDGLRVRASLAGLPIPSTVDAYSRGGVAQFVRVPLVDRILHLQVGEEPGIHAVDPGDRRRQSNIRVLATGATALRRIHYSVPATLEVDAVQVRPGGAVAYGRVPFERIEGGIAFDAPQGEIWILVRAGRRWATGLSHGTGDVAFPDLPEANYVEGVVVGGSVDGAPRGASVRFFKEIPDAGQAVLGDGFDVRVEPSGAFEADLPTGRYSVEVATRAGVWRRPAPLDAHSPGARLHLPLESP